MKSPLIHPTAIVDPKARLGEGVEVGPFAIIGPDVEVGEGTIIENNVNIKGMTTIGTKNKIGAFSTIGFPAQDKSHVNEPTKVIIGDRNDIREYVTVHLGTLGGKGVTEIGNDNQIMVHSHFAHDSSLGDNCMLANATSLAGHVELGSYIVTGGFAVFHQFCKVGDYCMIGGLSAVVQDVLPFLTVSGARAKVHGLNKVGLKRNHFSAEEIKQVGTIYKMVFRKGLLLKEAIEAIQTEIPDGRIKSYFLEFIEKSNRGILR